jgi:ribosome-associated translation inhibitor RaiA/cold shock CspA family protein
MQVPLEVTFKDMPASDALRLRVDEYVAKLERVFPRIVRCEVQIEQPHRHRRSGRPYEVGIRVTVPGEELIVSHDLVAGAHEDVYVAVRDAFAAMRRQLEDYVRQNVRRDVKTRVEPAHARVSYLDVQKEWGWLDADDGQRIYFHAHSVLGGADRLKVGTEVRFRAEQGSEGPQASTVELIGEHGRHELTAS